MVDRSVLDLAPAHPAVGLTLRLLGPVEITVDGTPRSLRYGKSKALLAYLAIQGHPMVRSTVASLLWESLPTDRAKANLRVVLNDLRSCLGVYLAVDRTTICIDRNLPVRVDVEELQSALPISAQPGAVHRLAALLTSATAEFLEGTEVSDAPDIEAFVQLQRTRLRQLSTDAIIAVLGAGDRRGVPSEPQLDPEQARSLALRLEMLDPWNEEGRRAVMETYVRSQRPATALAVYEEFRDGLVAGYGLVPEPATTALARSISQQSGIPLAVGAPNRRSDQPVTPLFGREAELASVRRLFRTGCRLVTLTGPGGVGKSRLAMEVAWLSGQNDISLPVAVVVVELADRLPATDLAAAVAVAMGVPLAGYRLPIEELQSILGDRDLLVVLDNGESFIGPLQEFIESILTQCPGIRVLLTSRIPLRARSEHVLALASLPTPSPDDDEAAMADNAAVQLVLARAQAIGVAITPKQLPEVAALCRQVDGLPLALELASTQLRLVAPGELVDGIVGALEVVSDEASDRPDRHRTLRHSIQWSYDLLGENERRLFRLLGIFRSGAAIGAVAGMIPSGEQGWPSLVRVVDAWLVQRTDGPGGTRLTMSAPIRSFALELLAASGELSATAERHAQVFLDFAIQADRSIRGPDQVGWLARLDTEHDNLDAALTTLVESGRAIDALRMTDALSEYWQLRRRTDEAAGWFERVRSMAPAPAGPELQPLLATAAVQAAMLAIRSHRLSAAVDLMTRARQEVADVDDRLLHAELVFAEVNMIARFNPSPDGGNLADRLESVVATMEEHGTPWDVARIREYQAWMAMADGDFGRARVVAVASRRGFEASGDRWGMALTTVVTANVDGLEGRSEDALPRLHDAFRTLLGVGDLTSSLYAMACGAIGATLVRQDPVAARMFGALSAELERTGMVMPEMAQDLHHQFVTLVRARLEPGQWDASWEAGRTQGFEVDWPAG